MEEDFRFKCFIYLIGVALLAGASWVAIHAIETFYHLFLVPTYIFTLNYFRIYGRSTAEIAILVFMVGMGLRIHERVMRRVASSFDRQFQSLNISYQSIERRFHESEKIRETLIRNEEVAKEKLRSSQQEVKDLKAWIKELEAEIERLENPIAVSAREASLARIEGEAEILDGVKDARNRYEY